MRASAVLACLLALTACSGPPIDAPPVIDAGPDARVDAGGRVVSAQLTRVFGTPDLGSCPYASPQLARPGGVETIVATTRLGRLLGLDPATGAILWEHLIEPTDGGELQQFSTPAIVDDRLLVVAWQEVLGSGDRFQRAAVFDMVERRMHPDFPLLEIEAAVPTHDGSGTVTFLDRWQLQRSRLVARAVPDRELGLVYLAYGNGPSDQPFHGWLFELDMDAWGRGDVATAMGTVFVSTAENDCGPPGNRNPSVCGGGIWNAWGIDIEDRPDGTYELVIPTGNGRMDIAAGAYAHSVLRIPRGLAFDDGCDDALCAGFDDESPDRACMDSCANVFMARLMPDDPPLAPTNGICDGLSFVQCYGVLDADLGASSPTIVDVPGGPRVMVQPGKDGGLYLVDYQHFGRLYQRIQARDFCGTPEQACEADWAGTFVTRATQATLDGEPIVIVVSLMLDRAHWSGVSAYRVHMEGGEPRLTALWDVPRRDAPEALESFRAHSAFPVVVDVGGEPYVIAMEVRRFSPGPPGVLWTIRVRDGEVTDRDALGGSGNRYTLPLVHDGMIYVNDCEPNAWDQGSIVAYRIEAVWSEP